jgi:hypothetical protein
LAAVLPDKSGWGRDRVVTQDDDFGPVDGAAGLQVVLV